MYPVAITGPLTKGLDKGALGKREGGFRIGVVSC